MPSKTTKPVKPKSFAELLRQIRTDRSQSQEQAAKRVGVARITWTYWERGQKPRYANLARIAKWSGIGVGDLAKMLSLS